MTRACGDCSKPCKKFGEPRRNGVFLDQIVICTRCTWSGVETEIVENEILVQLDLFDFSGLPEFGARAHERGDDGEQADGAADHADALA